MSNSGTTIHVIDDDEGVREALGRMLSALGFEVRQYATAGDFLLSGSSDVPGCVLLDVFMPGPSGLELQVALSNRVGAPPVIFLTGMGDIPMSVLAMKQGAVEFLTKPVDKEQLLSAIAIALQKDAESRADQQMRWELLRRFETLTVREKIVCGQVVAGKLNKQIASSLGVCERTVKAHRAQVMEKMRAHSVAELVYFSLGLDLRVVRPSRTSANHEIATPAL